MIEYKIVATCLDNDAYGLRASVGLNESIMYKKFFRSFCYKRDFILFCSLLNGSRWR